MDDDIAPIDKAYPVSCGLVRAVHHRIIVQAEVYLVIGAGQRGDGNAVP